MVQLTVKQLIYIDNNNVMTTDTQTKVILICQNNICSVVIGSLEVHSSKLLILYTSITISRLATLCLVLCVKYLNSNYLV